MPSSEHNAPERSLGILVEKSKRKRIALWLLLATVCGLIYWFAHWETERYPSAADRLNYPSFIITNFTTDAYNTEGQLSYKLQAKTLTHFEETDRSVLDLPQFTEMGDESRMGWHTTANKGLVINNHEEIQLRENVQLSTRSQGPSTYRINTSALDLFPNRHQASTDQAVTIEQTQHRINSIGLEANWQAGELILNQEVRAHYDTTHYDKTNNDKTNNDKTNNDTPRHDTAP